MKNFIPLPTNIKLYSEDNFNMLHLSNFSSSYYNFSIFFIKTSNGIVVYKMEFTIENDEKKYQSFNIGKHLKTFNNFNTKEIELYELFFSDDYIEILINSKEFLKNKKEYIGDLDIMNTIKLYQCDIIEKVLDSFVEQVI